MGLGMTWPQVTMNAEGGVNVVKQELAVHAAVKACDALDGVKDGVIRDARACNYSATALLCSEHATDTEGLFCLSPAEARAVDVT